MCRNGQYTERGIKEIHGFMSERWRIEPEYAIKVDSSLGLLGVLLEPMTVVLKAMEQVMAVGRRTFWEPKTVLVTGAGPIGLLAALGTSLGGMEIHVLDRMESGAKPDSSAPSARRTTPAASATLASSRTSSSSARACRSDRGLVRKIGAGGVVCLTGVGGGGLSGYLPVGENAAKLVLKNNVIVGSVNANKRHWYRASQALRRPTGSGSAA